MVWLLLIHENETARRDSLTLENEQIEVIGSSVHDALLLVDFGLKSLSEMPCSTLLFKRIVLSGPPAVVEPKFLLNHVLQLKVDFIAYSLPSKFTSDLQRCSGPEERVEHGLACKCEELD